MSPEAIGTRGSKYRFFSDVKERTGIDFNINSLKPNSAPGKYHIHSNSLSIYYVLKGKATFDVNRERILAPEGTAVYVEKNEPHAISNYSTDSELIMIELFIPGSPDFVEIERTD